MPAAKPSIAIRDLQTIADLAQVEPVEREVWGLSDRDLTPLTLALASRAAGSLWIGAFDGPQLIGFAFALPGIEEGRLILHSHMLAVLPAYRDLDLGYKLKLAQRERALALGRPNLRIEEITWTFDPLQSKNAHLNFAKLGVVCQRYEVDFYGPETSSVLHRNGTDRLWVRWLLSSRRVATRIQKASPTPVQNQGNRAEMLDALSVLTPLVQFNGEGKPMRADLAAALARQRIAIEIPSDIAAVEQQDPALAHEWRLATRWAFTEALKSGFFVAEFCRAVRGHQGPGVYLLEKASLEEFIPELVH